MSKSEENKISRRSYLQVAGGAIAGLIVGAALDYVARPTVTAPGMTETVTETVTGTASPTTTAGPLFSWDRFRGQTLAIQWRSGGEADAFIAHHSDFEEATGIKINLVMQGREGFEERLISQMLAGTPEPDVVDIESMFVPTIASAGGFEPLDDYIKNPALTPPDYDFQDFVKAPIETTSYHGKVYALPFHSDSQLFIYRKDLFEKDGITPPTTFDEFLEVSKHFTKKFNPSSPTKYGTDFMAKPGEVAPGEFYKFLWAYGGDMVKQTNGEVEVTINSPEAVTALQKYVEIFNSGVVHPDSILHTYVEQVTAFCQGEIACMMSFFVTLPLVKLKAFGPLEDSVVGAAQIPGVKQPDGSINFHPYGQSWTLGINPKSTKKEAAWLYLAFETSRNVSREVSLDTLLLTCRNSILTDPEVMKKDVTIPLLAEAYPRTKSGPTFISNYSLIHEIMNEIIPKALVKELDPKAALDQAAQKMAGQIKT